MTQSAQNLYLCIISLYISNIPPPQFWQFYWYQNHPEEISIHPLQDDKEKKVFLLAVANFSPNFP